MLNPHWYEYVLFGMGTNLSARDTLRKITEIKELKIEKGTMKITGETKIKELVPEGYEISYVRSITGSEVSSCIVFKKEEGKDFNWYTAQYLTNSKYFPNSIDLVERERINLMFYKKRFLAIPFEMRIGLLKFICDDLKIRFGDQYVALRHDGLDFANQNDKIKSICPKEFINSLYE